MTKQERINEYNKKIEYCQSVISKYNEKITEYNQSIANIEEESNPLEELVNRLDFNGDGIVSIIDLMVIQMALINDFVNDPLYDSENGTYNGKSLDINNNHNGADTGDAVKFLILVNNAIKSFIDVDINEHFNLSNSAGSIIRGFYQTNHRLPTLEEFHTRYDNQNNE